MEFELLERGSFHGFQQEIIEFVSRKAIKNKENSNLKGPVCFSKVQYKNRYFEIFWDDVEAYKDQQIDFTNRNSPDLFNEVLKVDELDERLREEQERNT